MRKTSLLVCLSGIDGVGKTSLAISLVNSFNRRGLRSRYVYGRHTPLLTKPVMSVISRLLVNKKGVESISELYAVKRRLFKYGLLYFMYTLLTMFDYVIRLTINVFLPLRWGEIVICDRYFFDTLVTDVIMDLDLVRRPVLILARAFLLLIPKPHVQFLITAPEHVAFSRKRDTPSIDYLKHHRQLYSIVTLGCNLTVLDGSKRFVEVEREAREIIFALIDSM